MTTRQEAEALVADHIAELAEHYGPSSFRAVVQPELTHEFPFGWVVFYNSAQFLRTVSMPTQGLETLPFSLNGSREDC